MESSTIERTGKYSSPSYRFLIKTEDTILLAVNIQEDLVAAMEPGSRETFLCNCRILVKTARELDIPVIISEQMPARFGKTRQDILDLAGNATRISKLKFSCWREGRIMSEIRKSGRKTVIVIGVEAHVCVLMSVMDLMVTGHTAVVAVDAPVESSTELTSCSGQFARQPPKARWFSAPINFTSRR